MPHEFRLQADHFQIFVGDRDAGPLVDTWTLWDSGALIGSIEGAPEMFGMTVARYGGTVCVEVEVAAGPRPAPSAPWERLGDFRLGVPSGEVILWRPEGEASEATARVSLPPGRYAGEVFARDRDRVVDEFDEDGEDRYRLVLWPEDVKSTVDIRQPR